MEKLIPFATCMYTAGQSCQQLVDLVTSCCVNTDERLKFRLAHVMYYRYE